MDIFQITLYAATFLCSLVGGFLFAFTIVVMPGIRNLDDGEFIRAFQVMDSVIQNSQPLFMLAWVGSFLVLLFTAALSLWEPVGSYPVFILSALLIYLLGVQLPTVRINIPLNNELQALDSRSMTKNELKEARARFEGRWVRWNTSRTVFSNLTTLLLIFLLLY